MFYGFNPNPDMRVSYVFGESGTIRGVYQRQARDDDIPFKLQFQEHLWLLGIHYVDVGYNPNTGEVEHKKKLSHLAQFSAITGLLNYWSQQKEWLTSPSCPLRFDPDSYFEKIKQIVFNLLNNLSYGLFKIETTKQIQDQRTQKRISEETNILDLRKKVILEEIKALSIEQKKLFLDYLRTYQGRTKREIMRIISSQPIRFSIASPQTVADYESLLKELPEQTP